jgi:hypothetical protein
MEPWSGERPHLRWIPPPLASWERAHAEAELRRVREFIADDEAAGVDADERRDGFHLFMRRLTREQQRFIVDELSER